MMLPMGLPVEPLDGLVDEVGEAVLVVVIVARV